jgi:hypothetical protein
MIGPGQEMERRKAAIASVDRFAFQSLAGHMTSSYWVTQTSAPPSGCKAEIRRQGAEIAAFAPSSAPLVPIRDGHPAPRSSPKEQDTQMAGQHTRLGLSV